MEHTGEVRFFFLRLLALVAAIGLTLRAQAFWATDDPFEMFLPIVLWLGLIIDWIVRQIFRYKRSGRVERRDWALPPCLIFVVVCGVAHLPLRVMCWTHQKELQAEEKQLLAWGQKGALRKVRALPSNKEAFDGTIARTDVHHPFQIARSQSDIRFFLWENRPDLSVKRAMGFAYCPNDAGCGRASFWDYWDYGGQSPEHIDPPVEYYWDYSHGTPEYISLGNGWYATKVSVEDVGD